MTATKNTELALYMRNEENLARFENTVGQGKASSYIESVLLTVRHSDNPKLLQCSFSSIVNSALRAGALRLSCDPATKQAYLVPYGGKCTLIPGWKGYYDMAVRTGLYISIHPDKMPAGKSVIFAPFTGLPEVVEDAESKGGWAWTLIMKSGFRHTVYWPIEDIHAHRDKYVPKWKSSKAWTQTPEAMEKKTVLRYLLMNFGVLDSKDKALLEAIESGQDDDVIDGLIVNEDPTYEDLPDELEIEAKEDARIWPFGVIDTLIKDQVFIDEDFAKSALSFCCIEDVNRIEDIRVWGKDFMGLIDDQYTPEKAGEVANSRYMKRQREAREKEKESAEAVVKIFSDDIITVLITRKVFESKKQAAYALNQSLLPVDEKYEVIEAWSRLFLAEVKRTKGVLEVETLTASSLETCATVANNKHKKTLI